MSEYTERLFNPFFIKQKFFLFLILCGKWKGEYVMGNLYYKSYDFIFGEHIKDVIKAMILKF